MSEAAETNKQTRFNIPKTLREWKCQVQNIKWKMY